MEHRVKLQDSIDYIEKHLCEDIKLDDIAKQVHFSEFHFHRLFHKEMGISVMEYVRRRRLSEAAIELSETDEKVTNIAFKYQYNSEEAFSRSFKRIYGASPRSYRNKIRRISNFTVNRSSTYLKHSVPEKGALCLAA